MELGAGDDQACAADIEFVYEGYLLHYRESRAVALAEDDLETRLLAGDIGSYQAGSRLLEDDFGLGRFSPLRGWPTPVLYVPGNHEYDGLDFDTAHARLRATCSTGTPLGRRPIQ